MLECMCKLKRDWWYSWRLPAENEGEEEYMEKFMGSCDPHGGDMKLGESVHASTREYMGRERPAIDV